MIKYLLNGKKIQQETNCLNKVKSGVTGRSDINMMVYWSQKHYGKKLSPNQDWDFSLFICYQIYLNWIINTYQLCSIPILDLPACVKIMMVEYRENYTVPKFASKFGIKLIIFAFQYLMTIIWRLDLSLSCNSSASRQNSFIRS